MEGRRSQAVTVVLGVFPLKARELSEQLQAAAAHHGEELQALREAVEAQRGADTELQEKVTTPRAELQIPETGTAAQGHSMTFIPPGSQVTARCSRSCQEQGGNRGEMSAQNLRHGRFDGQA